MKSKLLSQFLFAIVSIQTGPSNGSKLVETRTNPLSVRVLNVHKLVLKLAADFSQRLGTQSIIE